MNVTNYGIGSTLTGKTVDLLIADDLVKDMMPTTQKRNIDWLQLKELIKESKDCEIICIEGNDLLKIIDDIII